jgi:hypothetical protein
MKRTILILFLVVVVKLALPGCSNRSETPITGEDSTIEYPSKSANGIVAKITFCKKVSKKTGKPIDAGTMFTIQDQAKVYSIIVLNNREFHKDKELMFHIDWIDPNGNSLYKKRIDLLPSDSSSTITSSISITPGNRQTGNYILRVYLFRELIAEKKFELINAISDSIAINSRRIADSISARITFCRSVSAKTGKLIGAGKVFTIKDKAKVLAIVNLENKDTSGSRLLTFYADWIGPNDSSIYRKKIDSSPNGSLFSISSTISISPQKRQPGNYLLRIYFFEKLIAKENFELVKSDKEEKIINTKVKAESITAKVVLCKKVSKKTGEPIGVDSIFTIMDKAKVTAFLNFETRDTVSNQQMKLIFDWIGPNDSSIYRKKIEILSKDSSSTISSSISISPEKRKPGNYILRVYLSKDLIAERKFELISKETK